jgi:hypothetical protein
LKRNILKNEQTQNGPNRSLHLELQALMLPIGFLDAGRHNGARHKFLKAEDDLLRILVEKYGETDWNLVSSFMGRRNARQCRERYKNYLSPSFRNTPWTQAEEDLLTQKVREFGPKWSVIAKDFEGRSDVNVKNHWAAMASRNERIEKYSRAKAEEMLGRVEELAVDLFEQDDRAWSLAPAGAGGCDSEDGEYFF